MEIHLKRKDRGLFIYLYSKIWINDRRNSHYCSHTIKQLGVK